MNGLISPFRIQESCYAEASADSSSTVTSCKHAGKSARPPLPRSPPASPETARAPVPTPPPQPSGLTSPPLAENSSWADGEHKKLYPVVKPQPD